MGKSVESYLNMKSRYFTDEHIIKNLIGSKTAKPPKLDILKLEKRVGLPAIPKGAARESDISRGLGNPSAVGLTLSDSTFHGQVKSLIPEFLSEFESSLVYFAKRAILGNLPRSASWLTNQQDIDYLTAALFVIHMIGIGTDNRVDWIRLMHEPREGPTGRTRFERLIPRVDSSLIPDNPPFVSHSKERIMALNYAPLVEICRALSSHTKPHLLTRVEVSKILNMPWNTARYRIALIDLLLSENFIPVYRNLGLKRRWILTRERKKLDASPGLLQRLKLRYGEFGAAFVYAEKDESEGPWRLSLGAKQYVTENETISFRMDLYNQKERHWIFRPWENPESWMKKPNIWNGDNTKWLVRKTDVITKNGDLLKPQKMRLFSSLLANRGSLTYRKMLLGLLGSKSTTMKQRTDTLCSEGALTVLYHPSLDYAGLPEGILVAISGLEKKSLSAISKWFMGSMPYLHMFDGQKGDFLAIIRLPEFSTGITISFLNEFLQSKELGFRIETPFHINSIEESRTYDLTMTSKLFDEKKRVWLDSWKH
ncbi:MAG: hypothetical protein ACFFD3_04520 [Candidatus Thorarchaeota archaeon]